MYSVKTVMSVKRRACRIVFTSDNHNSSVWKWYVVWICFKIWVLFQRFVVQQAIKISLIRSHSSAVVFQTFFLREITFSVILPFRKVWGSIYFQFLKNTGLHPELSQVLSEEPPLFTWMEPACFCTAVRALSPLHFMIAERDEAGWEWRVLLCSPTCFQLGCF